MHKPRYKRSRQRQAILGILQNTKEHPAAGWIHRQLKKEFPNLSMGTVYRNLNILADQDLIQKIETGDSSDRFDANTANHYHFICHLCGRVEDLQMKVLSTLNKKAAPSSNYQIDYHRLNFYGLCPSCSRLDQYQT